MAPAYSEEHVYARKQAKLTAIPQEALEIPQLKVLDLSSNDLVSIPPGVFPRLPDLEVCDLSRNKLAKLPEDIAALQSLHRLSLAHNKLTSIPDTLCQITGLLWLNIKSNSIQQLKGSVRLWGRLQVLNVSNNDLEFLPPDVGWLPLKELHVSGNPRLRIPKIVMKHGFKAIISYLQVVCEQHRLVEQHLSRFTHPDADPTADAEPLTANGGPTAGLSVEQRISEAANSGILDLKGCASPDALSAAKDDLHSVYVVDVRSSNCTELDAGLMSFDSLVILNASFNQISSIAEGVAPASLGVLNVSFNKLSSLPSSLGSSPVLQQVYLANNQLSDLPESFASLPLVDLFLSENEFTHIPSAVLGMKQLAKLSIACCKLQEVSERLGDMASLRFLDISFNELRGLPQSLSQLTSLNALNVSFNPLDSFPSVIPDLTSLLELNLDYTNLSDVPPDIGKLRHLEGLQMEGNHFEGPTHALYQANPLLLVQVHNTALTSLDLSGIGLTCFPPQLARLTGLSALNLSRNSISSLPLEFGLLTNVQHLSVKENPLVPPFRQIAEVHGSRALINFLNTSAGKVDLSNCELGGLPEQVLLHGTNLQQLKLANNRLTDLPMSMACLENLNTLVLDYNELKELPQVIFSLPQLSILMASCNQITALPPNIGSCSKLQAIVLQSNLLTELPPSMSSLAELKALGLGSNSIQGPLPEFLGACTALRLLDISANSITAFPESIGQLYKLKTLKATGNQLASIPQQFRNLHSLQELQLEGNQFRVREGSGPVSLNAPNPVAVKQVIEYLLPDPVPSQPPPQHQQPAPLQPPQLPPQPDSQPQPQEVPPQQQPPQQSSISPRQSLPQQAPVTQPLPQEAMQPQQAPPQAQPSPYDPQQQQQQRKPLHPTLQNLAQSPKAGLNASARSMASEGDREAQHLVAQLGRLSTTGEAEPGAQPTPKGPILTAESEESEAKKRQVQEEAAKASQEKWLYLQKHANTVAQDPMRPKIASGWDKVPLSDVPRLLAAISNPPPPPPINGDPSVSGPGLKRPQTMQRFKRVVDQSNMAVRLLAQNASASSSPPLSPPQRSVPGQQQPQRQ